MKQELKEYRISLWATNAFVIDLPSRSQVEFYKSGKEKHVNRCVDLKKKQTLGIENKTVILQIRLHSEIDWEQGLRTCLGAIFDFISGYKSDTASENTNMLNTI